jgi:hypothetical protein
VERKRNNNTNLKYGGKNDFMRNISIKEGHNILNGQPTYPENEMGNIK